MRKPKTTGGTAPRAVDWPMTSSPSHPPVCGLYYQIDEGPPLYEGFASIDQLGLVLRKLVITWHDATRGTTRERGLRLAGTTHEAAETAAASTPYSLSWSAENLVNRLRGEPNVSAQEWMSKTGLAG